MSATGTERVKGRPAPPPTPDVLLATGGDDGRWTAEPAETIEHCDGFGRRFWITRDSGHCWLQVPYPDDLYGGPVVPNSLVGSIGALLDSFPTEIDDVSSQFFEQRRQTVPPDSRPRILDIFVNPEGWEDKGGVTVAEVRFVGRADLPDRLAADMRRLAAKYAREYADTLEASTARECHIPIDPNTLRRLTELCDTRALLRQPFVDRLFGWVCGLPVEQAILLWTQIVDQAGEMTTSLPATPQCQEAEDCDRR